MLSPPEIKLGSRAIDWLLFVEPMDCKHLAKENGEQIHGILGMDVLKEHVLQIDPDNDVLQIAKPTSSEPPPGIHFPLFFDADFVPRIPCTIAPGQTGSLAIDTASYNNGSIDQKSADYVVKHGAMLLRGRYVLVTPTGANQKLDAVIVPKLECGNAELNGIEFTVKRDNRLGIYTLLRFRIACDFKNRRVYCLPSKLNTSVDRSSQLGVEFGKITSHLAVNRVEKGLGAEAGLISGDRILAINGFRIETQFGKAYHSLFCPSTSNTVVELERAGQKASFTVTIVPRLK